MKMKKLFYILFLLLLFQSCNWFSTRTPEEPDTGRSSYQPPTSADIVISNILNAVKEKNTDNYIACLSDSSAGSISLFEFRPAAEAYAIYTGIFDFWGINSERQYFVSAVSAIETEIYPIFVLNNSKFEILLPDSAVYVSDYYLDIEHNAEAIPTVFSGTMRLTIKPATSGLWAVCRWIDTKKNNDTIDNTWSEMKAMFFNK